MTTFRQIFIGIVAGFSFFTSANELDRFDYYGLSLQSNSYVQLNFSPEINTSTLSPLTFNSSSSSTGFRLFMGHQFTRYIATEVGVTSFGQAKFSLSEEATDADGNVVSKVLHRGRFETLSGDIKVIGTYPLSNRLFLKAHVGALFWDNEFQFLGNDIANLNTEKVNGTGVSLISGVGIGYGFSKKIAISLDFENTKIANITTQNIGVSLMIRM